MFSARVPTCCDRFSCTCGWPCSWKICGAPGTSNEASLMYTFCSDSCAEASPAPLPIGLRGAFSVMELLLRMGFVGADRSGWDQAQEDRGLSHDVRGSASDRPENNHAKARTTRKELTHAGDAGFLR